MTTLTALIYCLITFLSGLGLGWYWALLRPIRACMQCQHIAAAVLDNCQARESSNVRVL